MKNVNGLGSAMRLVESACEKGEITIIGEGGMPTPVELYNKCVAYINREYGVDILNLVAKAAMEKGKPCECHGTCTTVIVDVNEDEPLIDIEGVKGYLDEAVAEKMSYLKHEYIDYIVKAILSYCDELNDEDENVNEDILTENIYYIIQEEAYDIDEDVVNEIAKELAHDIYINYVS